jgi:hypothetical protein
MLDVPTNGVQPTQQASQNTGQAGGDNAHEIEDIDRELEEYLKEKRSGNSFGFRDHSVDDQLAKLREKFGARVTPTKESEKPREVEVVKDSPLDESNYVDKPPLKPATDTPAPPTSTQQATPVSHEELIRSLEEKYSKGESTNLPPEKSQQPQQSKEPEQKEPTPTQEVSSTLLDLKESIDPIEGRRVEELLVKASKLSPETQKSLEEIFLARFKRNKERKELYTKTQKELEEELEQFILKSTEAKKESLDIPATQSESVPQPRATATKGAIQSETTLQTPETKPVEESAQIKQEEKMAMKDAETSSLEKKYRAYLARTEKKPVVLVYEPENGFVRKPVDPNDSTLKLVFSTENATNSAVLTVFDVRDNELGIFKIPQSELDN